MANTASTTFQKSAPIPERSTRQYSATLAGLDGVALEPAQVTSIKFSLRDDRSDTVLNARNRVEVLNQNGGTLATGGAFAMVLSTDDLQSYGSGKLQKRRALFEVTYLTGVENHEVFFYVENLENIPASLAVALGALILEGRRPTVLVA